MQTRIITTDAKNKKLADLIFSKSANAKESAELYNSLNSEEKLENALINGIFMEGIRGNYSPTEYIEKGLVKIEIGKTNLEQAREYSKTINSDVKEALKEFFKDPLFSKTREEITEDEADEAVHNAAVRMGVYAHSLSKESSKKLLEILSSIIEKGTLYVLVVMGYDSLFSVIDFISDKSNQKLIRERIAYTSPVLREAYEEFEKTDSDARLELDEEGKKEFKKLAKQVQSGEITVDEAAKAMAKYVNAKRGEGNQKPQEPIPNNEDKKDDEGKENDKFNLSFKKKK